MIPEIKKILYATDLSKNSIYAFFYAADMAKRHDATIVILHSVEPGPFLTYQGSMIEGLVESAKKDEREKDLGEIKKRLEEFCKKAKPLAGHPCAELVSKILVPLGHPVEEILKVADEESCDVIVLGTHGITSISRMAGLVKMTLIILTSILSLLSLIRKHHLYPPNLSIFQPHFDPARVKPGPREQVLDNASGLLPGALVLFEDN